MNSSESDNDPVHNVERATDRSAVLRRGRRPRTRPRTYEDFVQTTPKKCPAPRTGESSSSESETELLTKQIKTSLFTNDDVEGQDIFKFKSHHTRSDLQSKANSATSSSKIPTNGIPKTPRNKRLTLSKTPDTPRHVNEIIKKRIINTVENESDSDFSASSSDDFVPEKTDEDSSSSDTQDEEVPAAPVRKTRLRRTEARARRDADYIVAPDSYFMMNSSKKIVTSDHTLERLKNKQTDSHFIHVDNTTDEHKTRMASLAKSHEQLFNRWIYALSENYSVLLYGLGSKRHLLQKFQSTMLKNRPCVIINGFFPSLTIKSVLETVITDLLECGQVPSNVKEAISLIGRTLEELGADLFLIVHNIDGVMLRNSKAQGVLSRLSQLERVHTIASIDHINAPLIWDHTKLSRFAFTWWDVTSFAPYAAETAYESGLAARGGGALQLSSLRSVYRSLTSNARNMFAVIVECQLRSSKEPHYQGLPFKELYSKCRERFLVSSDTALRAQLTEFIDHKLVKVRRTGDGENLLIPVDNALLQTFLDTLVE